MTGIDARVSPTPIFASECEECGDDMTDTTMDHLVEAYEVTGRIICDSCFAEHCENET